MVNVRNFGKAQRLDGLSAGDIGVITEVLKEFADELSEVYDGRCGTVILEAQATIKNDSYPKMASYENLGYGPTKRLLEFNLPGGEAESIFFSGNKVADEAIRALLDGRRFFTGHKGASLDSNIYKSSGTNKTYESGHLMVLNSTFGRFLVGCGDNKADSDKRREHDFIYIALARTIARMFPEDELLQRGYDWMRRMSGLNYYLSDRISDEIDGILNAKPIYIREYWDEYDESVASGHVPKPFCK